MLSMIPSKTANQIAYFCLFFWESAHSAIQRTLAGVLARPVVAAA